jgi:2-polyprenyl-3-methyl-5-hydroxy-6-metoxy-1,4-benzoquinol methylase
MSKIKENWEYYGKNDPYFAVATFEKFKKANLTEQAKNEFFQTGEEHIEKVWNEIQKHFVENFRPKRGLDFGCGVGRLVVPLANRCEKVVGVDISNVMLQEAQKIVSYENWRMLRFRKLMNSLPTKKASSI